MPPMIACTAIFRPLPSSFMLWARRNASSPKTAASSCCSSIFFLSKILPSSLSAFSVLRLSAEISCVGLSLMSMVPSAMADVVLLLASPLTGGEVRNQDALYDIFIGGKIGMREDGRVEIEGHDVRR